jgi:hypothetical protein
MGLHRFSVEQVLMLAGEDPVNEDSLGWTVGAAWVIDGATPLGEPYAVGGLSSAAWLAARVSDSFCHLSADCRENIHAADVVTQTQVKVSNEMRKFGFEDTAYPPSASVAYVSVLEEKIEVAIVGDVEVHVADKMGSVESFSTDLPNRLVPTKDGNRKWGGIEDLHEQRLVILNDHGFAHVLSLAPLHPKACLTYTFEQSRVRRILLLSDGFAHLRGLGRGSLLKAIARGELSLCEAAQTLRSLESQHRATPPEKTFDDATALLLAFLPSE